MNTEHARKELLNSLLDKGKAIPLASKEQIASKASKAERSDYKPSKINDEPAYDAVDDKLADASLESVMNAGVSLMGIYGSYGG